jgi:hypothetical protein
MFEVLSSIQEVLLILTQERDPFRSEHEELKFKYDERSAWEKIWMPLQFRVILNKETDTQWAEW